MALQSMTGFARATGESAGGAISWELRSVNGKGLDVRLRLPAGFDRLEMPVRQALQRRFARGNMQGTLSLVRAGSATQPVINEDFLKDVAELAKRLEKQFGCAPASADGLLALRGVFDVPEATDDPAMLPDLDKAIIATLDQAMDGLEAARRQEGAALGEVLSAHVDTIERLTLAAEADPSREPAAIGDSLAAQVKLLLEASPGFDEQRLTSEAALLATKADIREEIDRLKTHVASARSLLAGGGAVGRKLDFLSQEFNRESNTLCSKSNAAAVTAIGLELKAVIDQFREQVQNLE